MQQVKSLQQFHLDGARLFADRETMIKNLGVPSGAVVAEVGVAFGDFSIKLINAFQPSAFYAFDTFGLHEVPVIWGRPSSEVFHGMTHLTYYERRLSNFSSNSRVIIKNGDSSTLMAGLPDALFDFIYIDGDHTYDGVKKDVCAAIDKLKDDGLLVFNDYIMFDHLGMCEYGIVPVVNELCVTHNWRVVGFAFQHQMFCDIVLRRS